MNILKKILLDLKLNSYILVGRIDPEIKGTHVRKCDDMRPGVSRLCKKYAHLMGYVGSWCDKKCPLNIKIEGHQICSSNCDSIHFLDISHGKKQFQKILRYLISNSREKIEIKVIRERCTAPKVKIAISPEEKPIENEEVSKQYNYVCYNCDTTFLSFNDSEELCPYCASNNIQ